jgi:iron complex outermembrane receptor protein
MPCRPALALAGASLVALAAAAHAQDVPPAARAPAPPSPADVRDGALVSEVVVTARRRSERLQDVPQSVNAVTADTLQKLQLKQFQDIQTVVPGLTLSQGSSGFQAEASLRGVTFDVNTGAQPTVAMYLNDAPVEANFLFQSLFDVGQIEVLRGPQGTTRGISAPSGAITLTTHKPDLKAFGGYVDVTATDLRNQNAQGAINLPLIKDVLALRLAALVDQNTYDGVGSLHQNIGPRQVTSAERAALSFQPTDRFSLNITYQHLDRDLTSFQQVIGAGAGTAVDPPLTARDRAAVVDGANRVHQHTDVVVAQAEADFSGRRLSYVGSYQHFHVTNRTPEDIGDVLPGIEVYQTQDARQETTTQELRLSSDPAPGRWLDYTLGGFYQWSQHSGVVQQVGAFLPGAFGPPGGAPNFSPAAFDPRYAAPILIDVPGNSLEASIFGNLTMHLGDKTELTGGVRHIFARQSDSTSLMSGIGLLATGSPGPCAAPLIPSVGYPGTCDATIPPVPIQSLARAATYRPNIYNVSISRHLTRDILLYANTGTSWRPGPTAVGVLNANNNAALNSLTFLQPETSRSFEIGLKSTLLGGRARLDVAVWRQNFHNLIEFVPNVPYLASSLPGVSSVQTFNFTANADAVVGGVDIDSAFQITPEWNLALQYSYAGGNLTQGSKLPCNDSNFDGVRDLGVVTAFPAGTAIAFCSGVPVSRNPLWNISIQTEYHHRLDDRVDGFLRALATYYPQNNRVEPDFTVARYSLVNLYAGLRSRDGAWELSVFARNAFGTDELLDRGTQFETVGALSPLFATPQTAGDYVTARVTPRREVGVNVHYAWGSR